MGKVTATVRIIINGIHNSKKDTGKTDDDSQLSINILDTQKLPKTMYVFDTKRLLLKFSKIMRYYTYDIFKNIPSFSVKDILETIK